MLETFPVSVLVGTVLGFLSGLGVGGGSLLILWLTIVLDMPPETAREINLMFFLPAAAAACIFRRAPKGLCWSTVLPAIVSGCAMAILGVIFSSRLDAGILKKLFGFLLLFTGIRELRYRPRSTD